MPAHAWAKASASGPVLDFTNPANAKKIYDFLAEQSGSTSTYATNPLWQVVDGPYQLTAFNNTTGGYTMAPNPNYGGPQVGQGARPCRRSRTPPTPPSSTRSCRTASTSATCR